MSIIEKFLAVLGKPKSITEKPGMTNHAAGYFIADYAYAAEKANVEGFLDRARLRTDPARDVNDQLLEAPYPTLRYFLLQRKSNGTEIVHAEFISVYLEAGAIIGPVATAPQANRERVREQRMLLLARVSNNAKVKAGMCYAITVANRFDDARALQEWGFDAAASMPLDEKASLVEITGGKNLVLTVQDKSKVPASAPPVNRKDGTWAFSLDGGVDLMPGAYLQIGVSRGTHKDETAKDRV